MPTDLSPKTEENKRTAQLVRIYESACHLAYPTDEDINFRIAVSKALGIEYDLREMRKYTVTGPGRPTPKPDDKR
jgi:hypothetical protein